MGRCVAGRDFLAGMCGGSRFVGFLASGRDASFGGALGWRVEGAAILGRSVGFAGQRGRARDQAGRRLVCGRSVAWGLLDVNSTGVVIIRTASADNEEVRVTHTEATENEERTEEEYLLGGSGAQGKRVRAVRWILAVISPDHLSTTIVLADRMCATRRAIL